MDIEGNDFVIKDRRSFDEKGDLKEEGAQEEKIPKDRTDEKRSEGEKAREKQAGPEQTNGDEYQRPPLPEVNFNTLIFSLSSSALLHLGEVEDPYSGEKKKDLPLAKHTIDTINMLKEKTKGNLSEEEDKFLDSVLADLRWRFVKAAE